jgi:alpha-galactosidase
MNRFYRSASTLSLIFATSLFMTPVTNAQTITPTAAAASGLKAETSDVLAPAGRWTLKTTGVAKTPPMGWSSWNAFFTKITEEKVLGTAKILKDSGLQKKGYIYVNIDDGWWLRRDQKDGRLQIRTKIFPSAKIKGQKNTSFKPFVDNLHSMGFKAGIYSDIGRNACSQAYDLKSPNLPEGTIAEREVGFEGHVDKDIKLFFKDWGFDYVKVDACGVFSFPPEEQIIKDGLYRAAPRLIDRTTINRTDIKAVRDRYQEVADALYKYNPDGDFVFSICAWGHADVRTWGKEVGTIWRTSDDIKPIWTRMLHTFDSASRRALYAQPGGWNDPDMMEIGNGEFDANNLTKARSHFAMWAIINAPLIIGYDLTQATPELLSILGNEDLIRFNQDPAGHQGVIAYDSDDAQIIVKTLSDPSKKGVVIVNRGMSDMNILLMANHLKMDPTKPITLKNVWTGEVTTFTGETTFALKGFENASFEVTGTRRLSDGMYISEIPGLVHVAADGIIKPEPDPIIHKGINPWRGSNSPGERPAYMGWGGAQTDQAPYNTHLQINAERFDTGIGILANSRLEVKNEGNTRFEALVGIDDSTRNTDDSVTFSVYGDGKLLAETKPMVYGAKAETLAANVSGVKVVELITKKASTKSDLAVVTTWAKAALRK